MLAIDDESRAAAEWLETRFAEIWRERGEVVIIDCVPYLLQPSNEKLNYFVVRNHNCRAVGGMMCLK